MTNEEMDAATAARIQGLRSEAKRLGADADLVDAAVRAIKGGCEMSKREEMQRRAVAALEAASRFTAPYGILSRLEPYGRGYARAVTFGVARNLDAVLKIVGPNTLLLSGQGPLAGRLPERFGSIEEFESWVAEWAP